MKIELLNKTGITLPMCDTIQQELTRFPIGTILMCIDTQYLPRYFIGMQHDILVP